MPPISECNNLSVSRDQFPSPPHQTISPVHTPDCPKIPRFIFNSPKKKVDPESKLKSDILEKLKDRSEEVVAFIDMQLFHKKGAPWPDDAKKVALKLYYKSPSNYRHMIRSDFNMPAVSSTIYRWHSQIQFSTGKRIFYYTVNYEI